MAGSDSEDSEANPADESEETSTSESTPRARAPTAGKETEVRPTEDAEEDDDDDDVPSVDIPDAVSEKPVSGMVTTAPLPKANPVPAPDPALSPPKPPLAANGKPPAGKPPVPKTAPTPSKAQRSARPTERPATATPRSASSQSRPSAKAAPPAAKPRAHSATGRRSQDAAPSVDDLLAPTNLKPKPKPAHYLLATEIEKIRAQARHQPLHLRDLPASSHPAPPPVRGPARKAPKAADTSPPPPPEFAYCLGKKLADIRDQRSAAFASTTPRMVFNPLDVPAPGYCLKVTTQTPKQKASPPNRDDDNGRLVSGFGSTAPRDLTYSLTNGCVREVSPRKSTTRPPPPKSGASARPAPAPSPTWETIPVFSSFNPSPYGPPERTKGASSWALSKVERDPYETDRLKKELKGREPKANPGARPPKPPPTEKEWVELARKQVDKGRQRTPAKAAFGTSGPRNCLTFGKAPASPAPGDYLVP